MTDQTEDLINMLDIMINRCSAASARRISDEMVHILNDASDRGGDEDAITDRILVGMAALPAKFEAAHPTQYPLGVLRLLSRRVDAIKKNINQASMGGGKRASTEALWLEFTELHADIKLAGDWAQRKRERHIIHIPKESIGRAVAHAHALVRSKLRSASNA
jgi:hypothetical protein